jgi:hypothetical protein
LPNAEHITTINSPYGTERRSDRIVRPVVLDERWIYRLSDNPKESKPRVTLQGIGTQYHDYDEMLLKLLPNKIEDRTLKQKLTEYFSIRLA